MNVEPKKGRPKGGTRSKVESFLTGGRKRTRKVEWFFYIVFLLLMIGDVVFTIAIANYGSIAAAAAFPSRGFGVALPMVFAENGSSYPLVYAAVTANTTAITGLALVADAPISVHVNATIQLRYIGNVSLTFLVHDGEPYKGTTNVVVFPQPASVSLNSSKNGEYYTGRETIYFEESGNYAPQMALFLNGQSVPLHQITDYTLQIQPISVVSQTSLGQVNLILAVALYFFGVIDSFILMKSIYPKAFPKRKDELKKNAKGDDEKGEIKVNTEPPSSASGPN